MVKIPAVRTACSLQAKDVLQAAITALFPMVLQRTDACTVRMLGCWDVLVDIAELGHSPY